MPGISVGGMTGVGRGVGLKGFVIKLFGRGVLVGVGVGVGVGVIDPPPEDTTPGVALIEFEATESPVVLTALIVIG